MKEREGEGDGRYEVCTRPSAPVVPCGPGQPEGVWGRIMGEDQSA